MHIYSWARSSGLLIAVCAHHLACGPGSTVDGPEAATVDSLEATASAGSGRTYTVSPEGDEGAPGTPARPTTLRRALQRVADGDTIRLRDGRYEGSWLITRNITVQGNPGRVTLVGSRRVRRAERIHGLWRFPVDRTFDHRNHADLREDADMVWVEDRPLRRASSRSEVDSGRFYVDHSQKRVYIGINPSNRNVRVTQHMFGFGRWGRESRATRRGLRLHGLTFIHYANGGIQSAVPGTEIRRCVFRDNVARGARIMAGGLRVFHSEFRDNLVRGAQMNTAGQVTPYGGRSLVFEHNRVVGNGESGIKIDDLPDALVRHNRFEGHRGGAALRFDLRADDSMVINNRFYNNRLAVFIEVTRGGSIFANWFAENDTGINLSQASEVLVSHNSFYDHNAVLNVQEYYRNWTGDHSHELQGPGHSAGTRFTNNVVSVVSGSEWHQSFLSVNAQLCRGGNARRLEELRSNYFHRSSSNTPANFIRIRNRSGSGSGWECPLPWRIYPYISTLAAAEDIPGAHTSRMETIRARSPVFVDGPRRQFALKPTSPASVMQPYPSSEDLLRLAGWAGRSGLRVGAEQ